MDLSQPLPLKDGQILRIGHATPAEAEDIVAYLNRVSAETDFLGFGRDEFGLTAADEAKIITGLEGGRFNFMLVGRVAGQIASVVTIMRSKRPRLQHVGDFGISVAKSHWGLGVGKQMTLAMLWVARQVGVRKVDLKVRDDNANAIALYESVGFVREGLSARALNIRGHFFDDIIMGICLDP